MPKIAAPAHGTLGGGRGRVERGANVEIEDRLAGALHAAGVVVDHVTDFLHGAVRPPPRNVPVVAVEGRLAAEPLRHHVAQRAEDACLRSRLLRPALEAEEFGLRCSGGVFGTRRRRRREVEGLAARGQELALRPLERDALLALGAQGPAVREARAEDPLPLLDLGPRSLVQEVVHRNHALHRVRRCVRVPLAQHRVVHLLWRRVFPVAFAVAARDRRGFALEWEGDRLRGVCFPAVGKRRHVV